jgi:hypothetical protein
MINFKSAELREAYRLAGFRERYAMTNGNRSTIYINGAKCYKWTYSTANVYQDANGATYDTARRMWID